MLFRAFVAFILLLGIAAVFAAGSDEPPTKSHAAFFHRETPDDPPARPALPSPGAPLAPPIVVGIAKTYQVNVDLAGANIVGDAANEPSIAIDPNDPNHMAIGWRQFDTIASNFRQAGWGYTDDGGRTWTFPGVFEPGIFRSDPVLTYNSQGDFYYNSLKVIGGVFSCQVFTSTNGGMTWGLPTEALGGDKQWMIVDRTGGMGHGLLYQAWNTAAGCCADTTFNRSTDGAASFEHPVRIPSTPIFGTLDVDSDGNLFLVGISPSDLSKFYVSKSSNAKDAAATVTFDWTRQVYMAGSMKLGGGGGDPNPGGLLGQAWLAVDRSGGPNDGNIYVLCSVDPPGIDPLDIHFIRSTDGGDTFSFPVRVNDDAVATGLWNWFGTMSVAPNGRIDVIWNDNREGGLPPFAALHYSFSTDGGVSWSANQRLSPTFNSHVGWPNQEKIGDYYDMVSDDVGASLAWAATFNNEQDVYYTRIGDWDCNVNGIPDSIDIATKQSGDINENGMPDECEGLPTAVAASTSPWRLMQNTPNPFNPATTIRLVVPDGGARVTLRVYDVEGRLVRTLIDGHRRAGPDAVVWDGTDAAGNRAATGLYFYRLESTGFAQTRKMVLLK
jgi:hypothetical protein